MSVKIIDMGESLLFTGENEQEVDAALQERLQRGCTIVSSLSKVGRSWVASCTPPLEKHEADQTTTLNLSELSGSLKPKHEHDEPVRQSMGVKIIDAGETIILRGESEEAVHAALQKFLRRGSKEIGEISRVGRSQAWVGTCTIPLKEHEADKTTTLNLSDLAPPPDPDSLRESKGECSIEKVGFKRVITGPTRIHVTFVVEELRQLGGDLIGEIEEENGQWVAICDTAGIKNTGFRW